MRSMLASSVRIVVDADADVATVLAAPVALAEAPQEAADPTVGTVL